MYDKKKKNTLEEKAYCPPQCFLNFFLRLWLTHPSFFISVYIYCELKKKNGIKFNEKLVACRWRGYTLNLHVQAQEISGSWFQNLLYLFLWVHLFHFPRQWHTDRGNPNLTLEIS